MVYVSRISASASAMSGVGVACDTVGWARGLIEAVLPSVFTVCVLCGMPASPVHAQYRAGSEPSLRDLYSVRVYAVPDVSVDAPVPLSAPGATSGTSGASPTAPSRFPFVNFLPTASAPGLRGSPGWPADVSSEPGFSAPSVGDSWSLGPKNWRYLGSSGFGVTLGNGLSRAPAWSQPVRLVGIGVYRAPFDDEGRASAWQYAMAVGALDDPSDTAAASGGLAYGPAASDTFVRYTVDPNLSLTSQIQWMPDLFAVGLGGRYSMSDWGSWVLGVSRAQQSLGNGWRYQLGYQVDVSTDVQLSWVNEQRGDGYSDLSGYGGVPAAGSSVRNQWQLSVPMGRWGDISGTYEQLDATAGESRQTFGLAQQFWYSPHLRVRLEANRDIATGAYGLGVKLMLPLD